MAGLVLNSQFVASDDSLPNSGLKLLDIYFSDLLVFPLPLIKMGEYFEEDDKDLIKMGEYFEEDDKDFIEIIYDSTAIKKEEVKDTKDVKDVKKDLEQQELELMAKMNLPTKFDYSNGRYRDDERLKEDCRQFCSLCQVQLRNVRTYEAHLAGKKHLKKLISAHLQN